MSWFRDRSPKDLVPATLVMAAGGCAAVMMLVDRKDIGSLWFLGAAYIGGFLGFLINELGAGSDVSFSPSNIGHALLVTLVLFPAWSFGGYLAFIIK